MWIAQEDDLLFPILEFNVCFSQPNIINQRWCCSLLLYTLSQRWYHSHLVFVYTNTTHQQACPPKAATLEPWNFQTATTTTTTTETNQKKPDINVRSVCPQMKRRTFTLWYTKPHKIQREPQGTWFMHHKPLKTQREPQRSKSETLQNTHERKTKKIGSKYKQLLHERAVLFSHIVWHNRKRGVYITEVLPSLAAGWCSGHL